MYHLIIFVLMKIFHCSVIFYSRIFEKLSVYSFCTISKQPFQYDISRRGVDIGSDRRAPRFYRQATRFAESVRNAWMQIPIKRTEKYFKTASLVPGENYYGIAGRCRQGDCSVCIHKIQLVREFFFLGGGGGGRERERGRGRYWER